MSCPELSFPSLRLYVCGVVCVDSPGSRALANYTRVLSCAYVCGDGARVVLVCPSVRSLVSRARACCRFRSKTAGFEVRVEELVKGWSRVVD